MSELKLLLLEDDAALAATLARVLGRQGYGVTHLASGETLLATAERLRPQVVLLDLKLAEGTSLGLVAPLRALLPEARVLMITGFASIATAVAAIKAGADDYLPKPLDLATLLQKIGGEALEAEPGAERHLSPQRLEWEHIQQVLAENDGNVSATARALGMHRRTLQRKLAKHPVRS
ncbi:response regulator [Gallaecimonas sp. GXIMD4217]|uniref:response regulator transcription factor n=1 Tax=Gallaecimonas sp. GXIMD4217 TaxID=3131927 RepID=UPI00311AF7FF